MINLNQINNLKFIYKLFANLKNYALIWCDEINDKDEEEYHIEKLNMILGYINENDTYVSNFDDLIITVEELLKEYILQKYLKNKENDYESDSDIQ